MLKLLNIVQSENFISSENNTLINVNFYTFKITVIHNGQCVHLVYDQDGFTFDNVMKLLLVEKLGVFGILFSDQNIEYVLETCLFLNNEQKEYCRLKYA